MTPDQVIGKLRAWHNARVNESDTFYNDMADAVRALQDENAKLRKEQVRYVEVDRLDNSRADGKVYSMESFTTTMFGNNQQSVAALGLKNRVYRVDCIPPRTESNTVPLVKSKTLRERFREICDHFNQRGTVAEINNFFDALSAAGLLREEPETICGLPVVRTEKALGGDPALKGLHWTDWKGHNETNP